MRFKLVMGKSTYCEICYTSLLFLSSIYPADRSEIAFLKLRVSYYARELSYSID